MSVRTIAWAIGLAALSACASSPVTAPVGPDAASNADAPAADVTATPDAAVTADVTVVTDAPADAAAPERREVTVPPQVIMPGQEVTRCREVRLGNAAPMLVRGIHVSIPHGSHHVIVYRSRATTEQPELTDCRGLSGILAGTAPLFIAQQPESGIDFPDGVGLSIAANQMIRLEEHFINTGSTPIMVGARVTFDLADGDGLTPADMMFWGTAGINVAPHTMGTAQYFRPVLAGVNVFGLTSHTHQYGVRSTVERATALTGMGTELHRSTNWEEPPLTRFSPPLTFAEGEGLRLVCTYNNTSNGRLSFGESFNQEMCFLWAYYYPSQGFHVCFDRICQALPL